MPKDDFEPLRLIEMVRNRPVLWDKTAECYTRKNKYIYWEQIGKELYASIWDSLTEEQRKFRSFQLSKKWINLRDCYVRNRRESLTNYSLYGIKKRKYQYSSEMAFLDKSWRLKRSNMNNNNNNNNNNNIKMEKDDTGDTVSFNGEVNLNNHYNGQYTDDNSNENDMMMGYDELRSNNSQYSDNINPVVEISCAVGNDPRSNHLAGVVTFDDGDDIDEDDISLHGSQLSNLSQSMIYHRDSDEEDEDDDDPIMDENGMNMAMNHLSSHHLQSPPLIRNHRPTVRIHNNSKFNSNSNGISSIVPGVATSSTPPSHNPGTNENTTMSDILQNLMVDCIQKFDNPMVSFMLSLRPAYSSFCNRKISIFQRKIMDILHEVDSLPIEELSSNNSNSNTNTTATPTLESFKNLAQNSSPNPVATTNGIDNCSKSKIINYHSKRIRNR